MKKVMNFVLGGIEHKIFNVFLITMILVAAAFLGVIGFQSRKLREISAKSSQEQQESVSEISSSTMNSVIQETLGADVETKAAAADNIFSDLKSQVQMLAQYTGTLYAESENYPEVKVALPDERDDGKVSIQLLAEKGIDLTDPELTAEIGLLGNMSDMMESLFSNTRINSCFVATANGTCIFADDRAAAKIDEDGKLINIPLRERPWYVGAVRTGEIYFTDVEKDMFTDNIGIVCAMPVYHEGKLAAVVGADLFLEELREAVQSSEQNGGFIAVINQDGHVIFSPKEEGLFTVRTSDSASDLRQTEDKEFSAFIEESLKGSTDVNVIPLEGKEYYMAGSSLDTVGWAVISVVDREATEVPMKMMQEQMRSIVDEASEEYRGGVRKSTWTLTILLLLIFVAGTAGVLIMARKIVRPLSIMTHKISSLSGKKPLFVMEDVYRTGDEVQVLAESFARLSRRTVQYVDEVKRITAEKERIGAELGMATEIQASQLPSIFPAFPDRREFDIYATMNPAKEVGGDFYDFFLIDDDHIALVMADVSGKGVPAALFMMIAKILIKNRVLSGDSPAVALSHVNNQLTEGNEAEMFVTVWLGILELSTGKGVAANAGHEHPAVRRSGGSFELVSYRHSPAVAVMEGVRFREHSFKLDRGDTLFVYTDGVPEATDSSEEMFGPDRMLEALNKEPGASPKTILGNVMDGITGFVKDAKQFDDITMLCLTYVGLPDKEGYHMNELVIDAKTENLSQVLAFIDEQMEKYGSSVKDRMQMDLAVEELFVNVANYAYAPGTGDVIIKTEIREDPRSITVTFTDRGMPYNPLEKDDPDITLSAAERKIGGLGIYMVKKSVDDIHYEYKYGKNILTIRKNF